MANWVTFGRFLLLFVLLGIVYSGAPALQLVNAPLTILIIALDGVDGWVARRFGEESLFGATFDIAIDRIVETVLWVVLAHLGFIGVWIPLLFIIRGNLVDAIRSKGAQSGTAAFDMMQSPIGRFLVAGRFMRGFYAVLKAVTFAWILAWQPAPFLAPEFWTAWGPLLNGIGLALAWASAAICIARGLPVIIEFCANARPGAQVGKA
ncbi:CDP-alcohol phosphatidyltransferase family protein [Endozoicomonas sp. G2_2]|uniref:CDP-alcohol phosphatidyltransferase family protein n=1 Tax=Gammaproteobacteria TaxID=1236 RepID=UPI000C45F3EA|nr:MULTISPECIES: CDP-alcohol phosphatidyltransferase family protein [Gammaproteobacteria]MAS11460.1 CDP-alcohol phosphatidyltransferase [Salinisphaera sp.]MBO9471354.1 CDP-alcohol phosphatidyltransferase family protein [Endozoicomonas sp. G2_2]|tara:strand:+ start:823 stop:1443 length:621 start_codon:yes stop_codon:yes gene_type:complete